jgi:hypothetical protein
MSLLFLFFSFLFFPERDKSRHSECLSPAKFRYTDSVNPRVVLSRAHPRCRHLLEVTDVTVSYTSTAVTCRFSTRTH